MAASQRRSSRYQRDQRFAAISWAASAAFGALLAAHHNWSTEQPDEISPPVAPTISMHAWLDQSQQSINVLVTARNNIAAAASRRDIPATGVACQAATDAVAGLRAHLPSPEAAVNQSLQQAISSYTIGLPDCVSASRTVDGEVMQRATSNICQGDAAMQSALDIVGDEAGPAPGELGMLIV